MAMLMARHDSRSFLHGSSSVPMRGDRGLTAEKWEKRHGAQVDVALDVGGRGGVGHLGAAIARFERTRTRKRGLGMTSVAITELSDAEKFVWIE